MLADNPQNKSQRKKDLKKITRFANRRSISLRHLPSNDNLTRDVYVTAKRFQEMQSQHLEGLCFKISLLIRDLF
jgi:hypothetical protein